MLPDRSHLPQMRNADLDALRLHMIRRARHTPVDIEQSVSDTCWAYLRYPKPIRFLRPWLTRTAERAARNGVLRRSKHRSLEDPNDIAAPEQGSIREHAASFVLREVLDELPAAQKRILELCEVGNWTISEAARELGLSRSTARTHRDRALAKPRKNSRLIQFIQ